MGCGVVILLDTHVLLWLVLGDPRLKPAVRRRMTTARDIGVTIPQAVRLSASEVIE